MGSRERKVHKESLRNLWVKSLVHLDALLLGLIDDLEDGVSLLRG